MNISHTPPRSCNQRQDNSPRREDSPSGQVSAYVWTVAPKNTWISGQFSPKRGFGRFIWPKFLWWAGGDALLLMWRVQIFLLLRRGGATDFVATASVVGVVAPLQVILYYYTTITVQSCGSLASLASSPADTWPARFCPKMPVGSWQASGEEECVGEFSPACFLSMLGSSVQIQGVFLTGTPPKSSKYKKVNLS